MLDTPSPEIVVDYTSTEQRVIAHLQELRTRVWNALIPTCAIRVDILPHGVRYIHPTKGERFVGKRRFAIRGVI
jgi:hypothetical protein